MLSLFLPALSFHSLLCSVVGAVSCGGPTGRWSVFWFLSVFAGFDSFALCVWCFLVGGDGWGADGGCDLEREALYMCCPVVCVQCAWCIFFCFLVFVQPLGGFCSLLLVWFELLVGGVLNVGALPAMGGG